MCEWQKRVRKGRELKYVCRGLTALRMGFFDRIIKKAGNIWKGMGKSKNSWEILVTQLRDYRAGKAPYNASYNLEYDNPIIWWSSCESNKPYIQMLALKLFAIIPQSAGYERNFSNLRFFYGKRRQRMQLHTLESLAK